MIFLCFNRREAKVKCSHYISLFQIEAIEITRVIEFFMRCFIILKEDMFSFVFVTFRKTIHAFPFNYDINNHVEYSEYFTSYVSCFLI